MRYSLKNREAVKLINKIQASVMIESALNFSWGFSEGSAIDGFSG